MLENSPFKMVLLAFAYIEMEDYGNAHSSFLSTLRLSPDDPHIMESIKVCVDFLYRYVLGVLVMRLNLNVLCVGCPFSKDK